MTSRTRPKTSVEIDTRAPTAANERIQAEKWRSMVAASVFSREIKAQNGISTAFTAHFSRFSRDQGQIGDRRGYQGLEEGLPAPEIARIAHPQPWSACLAVQGIFDSQSAREDEPILRKHRQMDADTLGHPGGCW